MLLALMVSAGMSGAAETSPRKSAVAPSLHLAVESRHDRSPSGQVQPGPDVLSWRDATIDRLRALDLGTFDYHGYRISDRQLRLADMLTGRLSQVEYGAQPSGPDFLDLYGFTKAGEADAVIDWAATSPDGFEREKSEYGPFIFSIPLASAYWKTGDPAYMRRWFAIAADFARVP